MTPEQIEREREAFEASVQAWPNYAEKFLSKDSRHPSYYGNPVVQGAWEGWKARAQSERVLGVGELSKLCAEWVREGDGYSGTTEDGRKALYGCAYDLRALIAKAGGG